MVGLAGADLQAIKILYKFFLKAIISSDQFFDKFVDRREFLNQLVMRPLIQTGRTLKSMSIDNQVEILKRTRTLLKILLTWIAKTALVRNGHVFTLNILDNEELVELVQQFQEFEVEQYMSLFERYSRSPKAMRYNLEIYTMLCKLLTLLVNTMTHYFEFPLNEVTNSRVFMLSIPSFL